MSFIIEYKPKATDWVNIDVQLFVREPTIDPNEELMTVWEFEGTEELELILNELGVKHGQRSTKPDGVNGDQTEGTANC
jgi:hypothetical protein